jgi:hypothetical protein
MISLTAETINFFCHHRPHQRWPLHTFGPVSEQLLIQAEKGVSMTAELTATQQATITYANPKDKKGNDAPVEAGSLVWKSSDETVVAMQSVTENPIVGRIVCGLMGTCEIWPEADADLGSGVKTILGEKVAVHVVAGEASAIGSPVLGTPEEQPDAPPA